MAYQALYRKYRPSSFSEVVGQKHIIQTLKNAVERDRIAHAYLFCGPRGTGKTSIAKIFAKMLNCENNPLEPCGTCLNCQMAAQGSHPDIIEIDAASNNGVDEVRDLIDKVKYAPMKGKKKVYIIDEVHMMTAGAFNALLKTIEEPPEHVLFILATTEPHKVISTIISRCQRFDFTSVSEADIFSRLKTVCEQEEIQADDQALSLISSLAQGGMRDSLSILDQCSAYSPDHITVSDVQDIYGVVTSSDIGQIFQNMFMKKLDDVIEKLEDISSSGMDLKRFTADLIKLLKDSIILDHSPASILVSESDRNVIQTYFSKADPDYRMNLLKELMDVYSKFSYASSILDYLESSILQIMYHSYEQPLNPVQPVSDINTSASQSSLKPNVIPLSHECPSDQSQNYGKESKKADISVAASSDSISDVSRETFSHSDIIESEFILTDDFILGLMNGADRKTKEKDSNSFSRVREFAQDLEFGRYANALRYGDVWIAGDDFVVFSTPLAITVKYINRLDCAAGFENYMEKLLGTRKKIFAVLDSETKRMQKEFIKRKKASLPLPDKPQIQFASGTKEAGKQTSLEDQLKDLFGEIEIIND